MDRVFNVQAKERKLDLYDVNDFLNRNPNYRVTQIVPLIQSVAITGSQWSDKYSNYGVIIVVSNR